jgi:ZIP family zinc transporter
MAGTPTAYWASQERSPPMIQAFLLGVLAQTSLVLSGLVVYRVRISRRVVGAIAAFGAGSLLAAIAFSLIPEAKGGSTSLTAFWLLAGAFVYLLSDHVVEQRFGGEGTGAALGIVVGAVVDGVPESLIFGIQLATGQPISAAFLFAVWISNIPQALAPSVDLAQNRWSPARLGGMWAVVGIACGIVAALGFLLGTIDVAATGGRAAAFAAGGLLAMLSDSLMLFAFERSGVWAGIFTVIGFAVSLAMS